jgi:hypothetical protein
MNNQSNCTAGRLDSDKKRAVKDSQRATPKITQLPNSLIA